jgi:hypothetical protein
MGIGSTKVATQMIRRWKFACVRVLVVTALLLTSAALLTQPVRDRILKDIQITNVNGRAVVEIVFSDPIGYVTHFPQSSGDELRVQLNPIRVSRADRDALFKREGVRPEFNARAALLEVVYEGDIEGGPFLTLYFSRPVVFEVIPGSDFRSLTVVVQTTQ